MISATRVGFSSRKWGMFRMCWQYWGHRGSRVLNCSRANMPNRSMRMLWALVGGLRRASNTYLATVVGTQIFKKRNRHEAPNPILH